MTDTQFLMEQAADRLEKSWKKGGNPAFAPSLFIGRFGISLQVGSLCLMDALALETGKSVLDSLGEVTPETDLIARSRALDSAGYVVLEEALPALRKAVLAEIEANWEKFQFTIEEWARVSQGHVRNLHNFLDGRPAMDLVFFYNDSLCPGGEKASQVMRRAIKEL